MKSCTRRIVALAGLLLVVCAAARLLSKNTFTLRLTLPPDTQAASLAVSGEGMFSFEQRGSQPGQVDLTLRPEKPGEAFLDIYGPNGEIVGQEFFRVSPLGTVYRESTGSFTGDRVVLVCCSVFFLAVSAMMTHAFFTAKGADMYSYTAIYYAGFSLFSLCVGALLSAVTVKYLTNPGQYTMFSAYSTLTSASGNFMLITLPFVVCFALAMTVSNIALMRHETPRLRNALGIIIGVALLAGEALGLYIVTRDFMGSEWEYRLTTTAENMYYTVFAYFECMLIGAIICGLRAARHKPTEDADFIIVLGCRFRRDGTLTPLLRGRVDRALAWRSEQIARSGRAPVIIPSGGQGPDEVMPEAAAMANYLRAQGVPDGDIILEDKSRNTYENMAFSKQIIDERQPNASVIYATTNYHVFRSGLWANLAGLRAEGIGSQTRWWYWPNAFMRECVGLLANRWKQEIALLAALAAFFALLSMTLG